MIISQADKLQHVKEYYFSRKLQQLAQMRQEGKDIINLGIGSPDRPPSPRTIERLTWSAKQVNHHGYQSYRSAPEFRQAIAQWYQRIYGVTLNPDTEILPLIGSKEGITHISMAFLNQGDEVLVPNPGYPTYSSVSLLAGAKIRYYDLDEKQNWQINFDKLANEDLSKVKILWLNYPNMPTGAKASDKLFEKMIALAHERQFLIGHDNPYSLILNDEPKSILSYDGAKDVAVELNSMSKSHNMPGWRLGWLSGHQDYIQTILKFKSNVDSGMFLAMQHAAIEALSNGDDWHRQQNRQYADRRQYAYQIFDMLGCCYDRNAVGLFVWAKVPDVVEDVEAFVEDILQQTHVFITPGFIFGSNGARYLRISLCANIETFRDAIQRIRQYLKN